jgi:hypothetical protein
MPECQKKVNPASALVQGPKSRENIRNKRLQTAKSKKGFFNKVAFLEMILS